MVPEHSPSKNKKAIILLEDSTFSIGHRFGAPTKVSSEVTFSTSMVSYAETIADSPCVKQTLTLIYPLMDDYAVPSHNAKFNSGIPFCFESDRIQVTQLPTNGAGMKSCCGFSAITADEWSENSATAQEGGEDRKCQN